GDDRLADLGPAFARGPERRQRLEAGYALVQRLQLRPARRALVQVPARPGRPFVGPQREQIVHCAVHHGAAPSVSSMPRSRACARASCDLEKLTVLPICSAISSCVYPSTSWSHTTVRDVALNRSNARSRSTRAGIVECAAPAPPPPRPPSSSLPPAAPPRFPPCRITPFDPPTARPPPHRPPPPPPG